MGYKIERVLNNNAVVTLNSEGAEIIIAGPGIAFGKKYGGYISSSKIEKIYKLDKAEDTNKLMDIFKNIPNEYIIIVEQVLRISKSKYNLTLNDNLYLALSDHIFSALNRYKEGIIFENKLLWEIKNIYQAEFEIAKETINMIKKVSGVDLPEDEAAFIALHIVNAESDYGFDNINTMTKRTRDILKIIELHFSKQVDKDSLAYHRLLSHIKYFVNRVLKKEEISIHGENMIFQNLKKMYPSSIKCIDKISNYIFVNENYTLENIEKLYLLLHISRLYEV